MGISIDVKSIVTPKEHHIVGQSNSQDYQYADLQALCQIFGWSSVPWLEPSPVRGTTDTSCGSSRYYRLLGVARAHARSTPLRVYNEEQPPALTADEERLFPHLLIRAIWSNYYLPIDFDRPRQFEGTWGTVSVGSSIRLQHELTYLAAIISHLQAQLVTKLRTLTKEQEEVINDASELCDLFLTAAQESLELNLPLLLHG
ncbi:MAG TPA: hypothetical protein PKA05_02525 [Roseiflexaceae bacterium]|mgnify:CR=1 FL=1|nr:hypothetical protein [Roseiflexaceae bacterium]